MFIESLFHFPKAGVAVERRPDHHFRIYIPIQKFPRLLPKLQQIFWEHYEKVTLLYRGRSRSNVILTVLWRHEYSEDAYPEGGGSSVSFFEQTRHTSRKCHTS